MPSLEQIVKEAQANVPRFPSIKTPENIRAYRRALKRHYHRYYDNWARGKVYSLDTPFYQRLWRAKLLGIAPKIIFNKYGDSLAYYRKHYNGLPRGKLSKVEHNLYRKMIKDRNIKHVPKVVRDFGSDSIKYVLEKYPNLKTTGELKLIDSSLHNRVNRDTRLNELKEMLEKR